MYVILLCVFLISPCRHALTITCTVHLVQLHVHVVFNTTDHATHVHVYMYTSIIHYGFTLQCVYALLTWFIVCQVHCVSSQVLLETMLERDYYKQVYDTTDGSEPLPRENGLSLPSTPVRSPSINAEMLELKKKSRLTQEQL